MKNVDLSHDPLSSTGAYSTPVDSSVSINSDDHLSTEFDAHSSCNVRLFKPGDIIFIEGSSADKAYIIESGLVEIFVGSGVEAIQLSVLGPGDIFGEMGLIDAFPRSASARAVCHCRCIIVSTTQIAERIESSTPLVKLLISMSIHRNRAYNSYFRAVLNTSHITLPSLAITEKTFVKSPQYEKILEDIKLESDLQKAVLNNELKPYYQPLIDLKKKNIIGFESLLRWHCPVRGLLLPKQFITLAEETSLILPIGAWVLERACIDLLIFQAELEHFHPCPSELFISVNISVRQFQEPDFFNQLIEITRRHRIRPSQIKLEVTERIFLAQSEAINTISQCRAAGFDVSLDDFGTGYSSLNYLERCEIDSLKIDQLFIQKICSSERARLLVSAIIDIAQKLGLPTVAEGIETPGQQIILQELGCDVGQGHLFSQPLPFEEALAFLLQAYRTST
jgi:EAL domain-containing protein (putative c-di-GMP-specific phosphodiesterase class I)/CRP-like cAMP-binding protein